jgi:hypothetical protein
MRLIACLLLLIVSVTNPEPRYFQYERTILGAPSAAAQACVALDADIFAHASRGLADLRLYRDRREVPYMVRLSSPFALAASPVSPLNLGIQGKQTVFDAVMPEGRYSDIDLDVVGQDFLATVTVSGSRMRTGVGETQLGAYTIFDLTRQKLGRSTILHLPESDLRYLHFGVVGPVPPESITGLTVEREPDSLPSYQAVTRPLQASQKNRSTVFEVTIPAHVPVERLVFVPGSEPATFSRDVRIVVQPIEAMPMNDDAGPPPEPSIIDGNLLRLHSTQDGHRIDEERLAIDTPVADFDIPSRWTISVQNGDDAPITNASLKLEMIERKLCFEAIGNAGYTLYYGDAALSTPIYDYSVSFIPAANPVQVTAAPEQRNSLYEPRPDQRPFTDRHPALLWSTLIAVLMLLGGIALRSSTQPSG